MASSTGHMGRRVHHQRFAWNRFKVADHTVARGLQVACSGLMLFSGLLVATLALGSSGVGPSAETVSVEILDRDSEELMLDHPWSVTGTTETEATVSCLSIDEGIWSSFSVGDVAEESILENGTIGILKVKAIVDLSPARDLRSMVLILDDSEYDRLTKINRYCKSNVTVALADPHRLTFSLDKKNSQERRILGRAHRGSEKIWILPVRYSQDLKQYYSF